MAENQRASEVLTPEEVAREIRVDEATVRRMCKRGELVGAFRAGRQWRIPAESLEKLKNPGSN